jgi:CRP-like cAMP-binding protein
MAQILRFTMGGVYDFDHMEKFLTAKPTILALQELLPEKLWHECVWRSSVKRRLFPQGKSPSKCFMCSGEVVLQRLGTQGESLVLQRARLCFVAEASLHSSSYHCDAVVTVSGELVAIPIERVRQALLADPAFAMRWMGMLNRELKRLRAQCERLSLKGVRDRLLHLIESEGLCGRLPLGAGLKSIALELGVTHEALYRSVAEMEKQGILRRADRHLIVI